MENNRLGRDLTWSLNVLNSQGSYTKPYFLIAALVLVWISWQRKSRKQLARFPLIYFNTHKEYHHLQSKEIINMACMYTGISMEFILVSKCLYLLIYEFIYIFILSFWYDTKIALLNMFLWIIVIIFHELHCNL